MRWSVLFLLVAAGAAFAVARERPRPVPAAPALVAAAPTPAPSAASFGGVPSGAPVAPRADPPPVADPLVIDDELGWSTGEHAYVADAVDRCPDEGDVDADDGCPDVEPPPLADPAGGASADPEDEARPL